MKYFGILACLILISCNPYKFSVDGSEESAPAPSGPTNPNNPNPSPGGSPLPPPPTPEPHCTDPGCEQQKPINSMGLITEKVNCTICHLNVRGDLGATVPDPFVMHPASSGIIWGNVITNSPIPVPTPGGGFGLNSDPGHIVMQGAMEPIPNPNGPRTFNAVEVFHPSNQDFKIQTATPALNFIQFNKGKIKDELSKVGGQIRHQNQIKVDKILQGNLMLDGKNSPIEIFGEVLIIGNLIIRGEVRGIGTIYVTGQVFIPDDIIVPGVKELFDNYRSNPDQVDQIAQGAINENANALRIASSGNIFIGNPGRTYLPAGQSLPPDTRLTNYFFGIQNREYIDQNNYNPTYQSYYTGETIVSMDNARWGKRSRSDMIDGYLEAQGVTEAEGGIDFDKQDKRLSVFDWYPDYVSLLKPEYELGTSPSTMVCGKKQFRVSMGAVSRIDAVLYAENGVGGVINGGGNYVINGGVIAKKLALLGASGWNLFTRDPNRLRNVFEMEKLCSDGSKWILDRYLINPQTELPINTSEIRYDYRLRNKGSGFNVMRRTDYFALSKIANRNIASETSFMDGIKAKIQSFTTWIKSKFEKNKKVIMPTLDQYRKQL